MPACAQMMDDDYMLYVYKVRPCDRKVCNNVRPGCS